MERIRREYAELCWHVPSEALKERVPGVCPWCCLQCCHGDVRGALSNIALRENALSADAHRGRFILRHCQRWIIERARLDVQGELQSLMDGTEGAQRFLPPPADSSLHGFWPESGAAARDSSGSSWSRAVPDDEFPSRELNWPTAAALSASLTPERSLDIPWPEPPPPPGLQRDPSPACTQHVPASAEPLFVDIGYPDLPQAKTLKGHVISSHMWETVNAMSKGDRNWITKEVTACGAAPDDYDVEAVLRERLQKFGEMVQRQRLRDCQAAAATSTRPSG